MASTVKTFGSFLDSMSITGTFITNRLDTFCTTWKLSALNDAGRLPSYVAPMYDKQIRSNNLSNNHGTVSNNNVDNGQNDSDEEIDYTEPTITDTYSVPSGFETPCHRTGPDISFR